MRESLRGFREEILNGNHEGSDGELFEEAKEAMRLDETSSDMEVFRWWTAGSKVCAGCDF